MVVEGEQDSLLAILFGLRLALTGLLLVLLVGLLLLPLFAGLFLGLLLAGLFLAFLQQSGVDIVVDGANQLPLNSIGTKMARNAHTAY